MDFAQISFLISIGCLAAIIYTLRLLVLLDKKISKIMKHQGISEKYG